MSHERRTSDSGKFARAGSRCSARTFGRPVLCQPPRRIAP
jgi:hypothetical protein